LGEWPGGRGEKTAWDTSRFVSVYGRADPRPSGRQAKTADMSLRIQKCLSESHSLSNGLGSLPVFETRDDGDGTVIDDGRCWIVDLPATEDSAGPIGTSALLDLPRAAADAKA
jgi:hypothetical protein